MSVELVGLLGIIFMLALMFLRVPIAISMAIPAILGVLYIKGWKTLSAIVSSTVWEQSYNYGLSVIPMFVLMGELLFISGVTNELFSTFRAWFGRLRGGLGIATIASSAVFSAASGSSLATTATMGVISSKEMVNNGYNRILTGGSIIAGGSLGMLIPPSTLLVVYGTLTSQSIAALLLAAIVPGIVLAMLYILTIMIAVALKPGLAPKGQGGTWRERIVSLKNTLWILALFVLVICGMDQGIFSPTEAAGVGAFGALMIAKIKGNLTWKTFSGALIRTVSTSGFLFAIVLVAFVLNYFFAISKIPLMFADFFTNLNLSNGLTFTLIILMYIILGAVMDSFAMIVVTLPIVIPLIQSMGYDLVWFGIIIVLVVEMAFITPPLGMACFVLRGVAPELELKQIFKGAMIFIIPILILVALLYNYPVIAMYLPSV